MKPIVSLIEIKQTIIQQVFQQYELNVELEKFYYQEFIKQHSDYKIKLKVKYFDADNAQKICEIFDWNLSNIGGK